jgi:hypothetical protein
LTQKGKVPAGGKLWFGPPIQGNPIVYDFSLPADASPLKLTYESRVDALDEPLPNGSEESRCGLISCAILWSLDNKFLMSSLDHSASSAGVDEILNVRDFVHAFVGTLVMVLQPGKAVRSATALPPFRKFISGFVGIAQGRGRVRKFRMRESKVADEGTTGRVDRR